MTTTAKIGPQDLPPKGGYKPFQIDRVKLRTLLGGRLGIALFLGCTCTGFTLYSINYKDIRRNTIEMRSARLALQPMLEAERDRALLKYLRRIRDEEADLMKDVPGWEVGTLFGEPVYHTIPEDQYQEPFYDELILHADPDKHVMRTLRRFLL
ncbi:NADH dehydrogenase (ubiquinone) B16.6 subunit [Ptiloglossa arizonensis]|uniref:NADH dehydrogenase (ubiquinone) B16.6 subunit n=1 Tax=Ptiloglossa arizonensis TaxID=3350558 RepID=UPI003FA056E4